ncbi:F-box and wd40 domain protein, partial [Reticulomyxa filosa]
DNSNKLILEIETLKKELNYKLENLRKEIFTYHSDIETIKKDFSHKKEQLMTTIKSLEEKNFKLKCSWQRLVAKLSNQEKVKKKEKHQNNIGISSSSNINFDQFYSSSKLLKTFNGHTGHVLSIDYSTFDDNQFLCSGSFDKTIRVWDIDTNKQIQSFNGHSSVHYVKFSPYHYHKYHQNVICSSSFDKIIRFWDIKHNRQLQVFNGHSDSVYVVDIYVLDLVIILFVYGILKHQNHYMFSMGTQAMSNVLIFHHYKEISTIVIKVIILV